MTFISRLIIGRPVLELNNVPSIVFKRKKSDYIIDNSTGYIIKNNLNALSEKLYNI